MFIDQSVPDPARIYRSLALIYALSAHPAVQLIGEGPGLNRGGTADRKAPAAGVTDLNAPFR
jgi:hypothetical protein